MKRYPAALAFIPALTLVALLAGLATAEEPRP